MAACGSFGTTAQAKRFIQAHGLGDPDDPSNIAVARTRIAEERERRGLSNESPTLSLSVTPAALLIHSDEDMQPLQFGHPNWVMIR